LLLEKEREEVEKELDSCMITKKIDKITLDLVEVASPSSQSTFVMSSLVDFSLLNMGLSSITQEEQTEDSLDLRSSMVDEDTAFAMDTESTQMSTIND
jgi:hypothetical protein